VTNLGGTGIRTLYLAGATTGVRLYVFNASSVCLGYILIHLQDIHLLEQLENGVYKGDSEEVHPSTLAQYCAGVNSGDTQSVTSKIAKGQEAHIRHVPVEAARSRSPFRSALELEAFEQALQQATRDDL
jgi:hypothetical protein